MFRTSMHTHTVFSHAYTLTQPPCAKCWMHVVHRCDGHALEFQLRCRTLRVSTHKHGCVTLWSFRPNHFGCFAIAHFDATCCCPSVPSAASIAHETERERRGKGEAKKANVNRECKRNLCQCNTFYEREALLTVLQPLLLYIGKALQFDARAKPLKFMVNTPKSQCTCDDWRDIDATDEWGLCRWRCGEHTHTHGDTHNRNIK